jgi:energy-coupling factor transporter ATP-binding protein EcfA2
MHLNKLEIRNIRALHEVRMRFGHAPGWHVILGENGAGKTTLIRAISAALVGPGEILRLDPDFSTWVTQGQAEGNIWLELLRDPAYDKRSGREGAKGGVQDIRELTCAIRIRNVNGPERPDWRMTDDTGERLKDGTLKRDQRHPDFYVWGAGAGWFSAAFGPYRRFSGGDAALESFYVRNPKIGAHLTAFKENAALTESVVWLKDQLLRSLAGGQEETRVLAAIRGLINQAGLLPEGYALHQITPDGPYFTIPSGGQIHLYELSEGIKSVTSLAFELIRLLLRTYPADAVLGQYLDEDAENQHIPVPGVVLIDEIDVHLHPTWQSRIGHWFVRTFPEIQFIVTTHSAFICRGASTVWHIHPAEGTGGMRVRQVTGDALARLRSGDILDAYGTGIFGPVTRDGQAAEALNRLAALNLRFYRDEITPDETEQRNRLLAQFPEHGALLAS